MFELKQREDGQWVCHDGDGKEFDYFASHAELDLWNRLQAAERALKDSENIRHEEKEILIAEIEAHANVKINLDAALQASLQDNARLRKAVELGAVRTVLAYTAALVHDAVHADERAALKATGDQATASQNSRQTMARVGVILEVLASQIESKPYAEMTADLQQRIIVARDLVRQQLGIADNVASALVHDAGMEKHDG
jgi:hypothetical protein